MVLSPPQPSPLRTIVMMMIVNRLYLLLILISFAISKYRLLIENQIVYCVPCLWCFCSLICFVLFRLRPRYFFWFFSQLFWLSLSIYFHANHCRGVYLFFSVTYVIVVVFVVVIGFTLGIYLWNKEKLNIILNDWMNEWIFRWLVCVCLFVELEQFGK